MPTERASFPERRARAAAACRRAGAAALLVGPGSDLLYLTGYRISPSERLTCLVLDADGAATLVVPELEAPRAGAAQTGCELRWWEETEDPYRTVAALVRRPGLLLVGDQLWAAALLRLQEAVPDRRWGPGSAVLRGLRARKDAAEIDLLRAAAQAADRVYRRALELAFAGRAERDIAADLGALLRQEGHEDVGFAIVAAGENGASPHHESGPRRIGIGDLVVMDFGGARAGYRSDLTRTLHVGRSVEPEERRVHDVVRRAQEAGRATARAGVLAGTVDKVARRIIDDAGYGEHFIHRTGHGIGLDGHEDPYLVAGNAEPLEPGMAFSIEPGVYLRERFGVRIEDIVVIGEDGRADPLNTVDRDLAIVG